MVIITVELPPNQQNYQYIFGPTTQRADYRIRMIGCGGAQK